MVSAADGADLDCRGQPSGAGNDSPRARSRATPRQALPKVYGTFFERKYIVKSSPLFPELPQRDRSSRATSPRSSGASPAVRSCPMTTDNSRQPGPATSLLVQRTSPSTRLHSRTVPALEEPSPDTASRLPGGDGNDTTNSGPHTAGAPLASSHMEEAIDLFLEEERLIEDLGRIQPVEIDSVFLDKAHSGAARLTVTSNRDCATSLPRTGPCDPRVSQVCAGQSRQNGKNVDANLASSSICSVGSRATVSATAAVVVAGDSPGQVSTVLPASGVGAYNSISLTKAQATADGRHVILTTLEWERFRRIVTNLLSTNMELRSKLRSTQQQFRQLEYAGNLEQTVARLKCEELQIRRKLAARDVSFADDYSLRAKLSECRAALEGFDASVESCESQARSFRNLEELLGQAIRRVQEKQQRPSTKGGAPFPASQSLGRNSDQHAESTAWNCPRGCAEVHREVRVSSDRCFIVSIHLSCPRRGDQKAANRPASLQRSQLHGGLDAESGLSSLGPTAENRESETCRGRLGFKIEPCPSVEAARILDKGISTVPECSSTEGYPTRAADSTPRTFHDLQRSVLSRELDTSLSDQEAQLILVVYDTKSSNVQIQALDMREWPHDPSREFLEGVVQHVLSNLQICGTGVSTDVQNQNITTPVQESSREPHAISEPVTLCYQKPTGCAGKPVSQEQFDESFFEETNEMLVYRGYHDIGGEADCAEGPSHFFVFLYQRSGRHLVARLFSPRSAQLLTAWIDTHCAATEYEKFLARSRRVCKSAYAPATAAGEFGKACRRTDNDVTLSAGLLRFIASRLRHEDGHLVLERVNLETEEAQLPYPSPGPSARGEDSEAVSQTPPSPAHRTLSVGEQLGLLDTLSLPENTSGFQATLTFRHPQLVERVPTEAGASAHPFFVFIRSRVSPLAAPESVSFVVYDPAASWCAESSFRLLDAVRLVHSRQRTFLQKLHLKQELLEQILEELSARDVCTPNRGTPTNIIHNNEHDEEPRSHKVHKISTPISPQVEQSDEQTELRASSEGSNSVSLQKADADAERETGGDEQHARPHECAISQKARALPALPRPQWVALLQEIYRDLKLTENSLVLPGISIGPVASSV
ncbi:hypothetical protein BESB_038970 [Besnoitia besnoiti]|uniref:Uncharacterized protein n=1 Tax=Besnoitia besnoiti TaxID=94643 RepID=A0A2A9MHR5_BESBE|nr:hypothetical protein BESB_038970 [Besnoitia besnoiti]PFH37439.1 hypothetical protein BESB_038970 [Besnoitia besnoiti]